VTIPGLEGLADDQRASLVVAVEAARERQRIALQQSIDAALEHVPRLLRGALRKVLFK
jgi:hypothetical protein